MKFMILLAVLVIAAQARPQIRSNFPLRRPGGLQRSQQVQPKVPLQQVEAQEVVQQINDVPLDITNNESADDEILNESESSFEEEEEEEQKAPQPVVLSTTTKRTLVVPTQRPIVKQVLSKKTPVSSQKKVSFFNNEDEEEDEEKVAPQFKKGRNYVPNKYEIEQNKAAHYDFNSNVEDNINDLTQSRSETRDGLAVKGMYSYSDGYFKRTVHYEADDKGYRIVSMESEPLEGPQIDLNGSASVSNDAHGSQIQYRVQSVPVEGPKAKIIS